MLAGRLDIEAMLAELTARELMGWIRWFQRRTATPGKVSGDDWQGMRALLRRAGIHANDR